MLVAFLQDLPDVQELIAEVNAEKYSLQAAAILGEGSPFVFKPVFLDPSAVTAFCFTLRTNLSGMFVFQTLTTLLKSPLSSR